MVEGGPTSRPVGKAATSRRTPNRDSAVPDRKWLIHNDAPKKSPEKAQKERRNSAECARRRRTERRVKVPLVWRQTPVFRTKELNGKV